MSGDKKIINLLYEDISYRIRGRAISVRKNYGPGHKEIVYQSALAEEFDELGILNCNHKRDR